MTLTQHQSATGSSSAAGTSAAATGSGAALRTLIGMELRQRFRSRGWYIMLAVFFVVVGLVTLASIGLARSMTYDSDLQASARIMFDLIVMFVLLLALLVSPALSANAISGDRANGTLAILQVTPIRTWHLMLGKWVAGWLSAVAFLIAALPWMIVSAVIGQVNPVTFLVMTLLVLVQFAVVTGIGVAISAITGRTLFAVVITYLLVAALSVGSLISFGLGSQFTNTTVQANSLSYSATSTNGDNDWMVDYGRPTGCTGALRTQTVADLRRTSWLLAPNPFVVVADGTPRPSGESDLLGFTPLSAISLGVRYAQLSPQETTACVNGEFREEAVSMGEANVADTRPVWPFGLLLQGLLVAGLAVWGHRRLHTPAGRLSQGTRIA
ncbi:MAG: ABC transporter permease [Micrococcus sp.]|nr:ABC transporter permease [Micrococcus sp.]